MYYVSSLEGVLNKESRVCIFTCLISFLQKKSTKSSANLKLWKKNHNRIKYFWLQESQIIFLNLLSRISSHIISLHTSGVFSP